MTVYDAHASGLRPVVARFFSSPFEREEALQEIWLQVYRMGHLYDPARGPLGPWLRTVAVNRCKEILRARGRRVDPRAELEDEMLVSPEDPETNARRERLRAAVDRFAAKLDDESRTVLRLSLVEERPHEEVARAAGITVRRCKYLRMKLLLRAAADAELRRGFAEVKP